MPDPQPPVIVVPGITATSLEDHYPLVPEEVWSAVLHKKYERISLHPSDVRYEAIEPARVRPRSLFGLVYDDLVLALRHDLSPKADRPTPVFAFPYDWRQDCARSADELAEFVEEVIARTRLVPHYAGAKVDRVDLVGHSMGGLVIGDYLARRKKAARARRVVTLGTPFRGAVDAVTKLATGMGTLTGESPRDREREAARTIPAIYQLLPTYEGAVDADPGVPIDLLQVSTWQPSVLRTLREFIRLHKSAVEPEDLFREYLGRASELRRRSESFTPEGILPEGKNGWFAVVGLDAPTQVRFGIAKAGGWFEFGEPESDARPSVRTGDGTVPYLGARPAFLEPERLACVTPDDFSFWELRDRAVAKTAGFHGALPTVNLVQRLTLRFLREDYSGDVWARPAPDVAKPRWPSWLREAG